MASIPTMDTNVEHISGSAELEAELGHLENGDEPFAFGSFDLAVDETGSPTALHILRQAAREALPDDAPDERIEKLEQGLERALSAAATAGHRGLFLAGSVDEPDRVLAPVRVPPRNRLEVTTRASRFELARADALVRQRVGALWAERGGARWACTRGHARPTSGELEAGDQHMRGAVGRTAQHDRGGAAEQPAGGHGKTRIEQISEEERERYARTLAETIERELGEADHVVVQGPPEFTARWTAQLSAALRDRLEQALISEAPPDAKTLAAAAIERGRNLQYERAATWTAEALSGAYGDRVAVGPEAIEKAATEGRIDRLIVHEDAVGHMGDAVDARPHQPRADAARVEQLVRKTLEQAGSVWFRRDDELDEHARTLGPVATLRW